LKSCREKNHFISFVLKALEEKTERIPERLQEFQAKEPSSHEGRLTVMDLCPVHVAGISMQIVSLILLRAEPCPFTR